MRHPSRSLPKRSSWPTPLPFNHTVYEVPLELPCHARCAVHAVADEANASVRQTLDSGNPYLLREARSHDVTLVQRNQ